MSQVPIIPQVKLIVDGKPVELLYDEDRLDLEYFHDQLKKAVKVPFSEFNKQQS